MNDFQLPPFVWRLAHRCDVAMDRRESPDRIFLILEELSLALAMAGFPGAADWVRRVIYDEEGRVTAA